MSGVRRQVRDVVSHFERDASAPFASQASRPSDDNRIGKERECVYALCDFSEFSEEKTTFIEGDASDQLFVVREGEVRISLESDVLAEIQERAYTSPIWYQPE